MLLSSAHALGKVRAAEEAGSLTRSRCQPSVVQQTIIFLIVFISTLEKNCGYSLESHPILNAAMAAQAPVPQLVWLRTLAMQTLS